MGGAWALTMVIALYGVWRSGDITGGRSWYRKIKSAIAHNDLCAPQALQIEAFLVGFAKEKRPKFCSHDFVCEQQSPQMPRRLLKALTMI